jgi:hypothetical protein
VNLDEAGVGQQAMLYPAPNAVGLLAAIATHSLLTGSARNAQKQKLQAAADEVLEPFRPLIEATQPDGLLGRAWPATGLAGSPQWLPADAPPGTAATGTAGTLEWLPAYLLTQDRRSLVLDLALAVRLRETPQSLAYQNTVRVVGRARPEADPKEAWTSNGGAAWHAATANLLAQALTMAMQDWQGQLGPTDTAARTVRYQEGDKERMERAQVLREGCDHTVIRTLRGWLMAVPSQELVRQRLGCAPAAAPAVAPIASAPVQANAQGPTSSAAGASTP